MTKTKRQLRVEAVERLKNWTGNKNQIQVMLDVSDEYWWNMSDDIITLWLIDLLTDDDSTAAEAETATEQLSDGTDSREKLEVDVREWCATFPTWNHAKEFRETVFGWLDRQAAITEREYWHNCCQNHVDYDDEYKPAIDELTAERDELREENEALRKCKACYERMKNERDELQAEIAKYEHDCELLFDEKHKLETDAQRWADAANRQRLVAMEQADKVQRLVDERDHLRRQVDMLNAQVIELTTERDEWKAKAMEYERIDREAVEACEGCNLVDEWKAKAESATHSNPYVGLVRGKQWERKESSDYYCGRCGWKVTDHDSYCPECGGALHEGLETSKAETYGNMTIGQLANLKIHNRMMADLLTLDKLAEDYLSEQKVAPNRCECDCLEEGCEE